MAKVESEGCAGMWSWGVIACAGYENWQRVVLVSIYPVKPSPNLPDMAAVYLYPSLGLFEGTVVSVGRGTDRPFQCIGYPGNPVGQFRFTPLSGLGLKEPPHKGVECTGLRPARVWSVPEPHGEAVAFALAHRLLQGGIGQDDFLQSLLRQVGWRPDLRERIVRGEDEETIRTSWRPALDAFGGYVRSICSTPTSASENQNAPPMMGQHSDLCSLVVSAVSLDAG